MAHPFASSSQTVRLRALFQSLVRMPLWIGCAVSAGPGCSSDDDPTDVSQAPPSESGTRPRNDGGTEDAGRGLDAGSGSDAGKAFDAQATLPDAGAHYPLPGTGGGSDGGSDTDWLRVTCDDLKAALLPGPLSLTRPLRFLGLYTTRVVSAGDPLLGGSLLARAGVACSDANQRAACDERLRSELKTQACPQEEPCPPAVLEGVDGQFTALTGREGLLALLGSVDTAAEAVLLAMYDDATLSCAPWAVPGGGLDVRSAGDRYELTSPFDTCDEGAFTITRTIARDGSIMLGPRVRLGASSCAIGRRPPGLCADASSQRGRALGGFFAQAARLEAASVYAFRQLARELIALAAPQSLIDAALCAIDDELRHTRQVAQLSRRYGAQPALPDVHHGPDRAARELALDNAVEGCVRETFGALLATHQAETACDPEVRRVMQQIACDETRHAQLSWALAAWLEPKLDTDTQRTLRSAQRRALLALADELDCGLTAAEQSDIGYPTRARCAELLSGLDRALLA